MPTTIDHFTRSEVLRIVGITPSQLGYWERLQLIQPGKAWRKKVYTFGDLLSLRAVKQLNEQRVPPGRLRRAVEALRRQLTEVETPLTELRIRSDGSKIAVEYHGVTIEPISGQLLMSFDTDALAARVSAMPERSADEWLGLAAEYEKSPATRARAIEGYERALEVAPDRVEAHINLGTLLYEDRDLARAAEHYRSAVRLAPANPLAHFNLGTTLEDLGDLPAAASHLREAARLNPSYADAHYNLARVCERLNLQCEARDHWRRYLRLDPMSPWAGYARERLGRDEP